MKFTIPQKDKRQNGMALILAIGFLAILSILGAVVLQVATRDLQGSSEISPRQVTFNAADRAVEYAMNSDILSNLPTHLSIDLVTADAVTSDGVSLGVTHKELLESIGSGSSGTLVSGLITDVGIRNLPPALAALHGSDFGANLYHVSVKTTEPRGGITHVDSGIVRLFKSDDETIFRTTGGG